MNDAFARPTAVPGAFLLLLTLAACASPLRELRIDGSPGVAPLVAALAEPYRVANPRAPVTIGPGLGSSARIRALAEGRIDVAMASHGVDTADLHRRGIAAIEIARTAVVFAVNRETRRTSTTAQEVCDILAGRVSYWTDGLPIAVHMRPADEVDAEVALSTIPCLRNVAMTSRVTIVDRADDMAAALSTTPAAFGLTSMPYVQQSGGRIVALSFDGIAPTEANVASGRYPMTRRAILLVRSPESPAVSRFLAFVRSAEAGRLLRTNGAVPTPF